MKKDPRFSWTMMASPCHSRTWLNWRRRRGYVRAVLKNEQTCLNDPLHSIREVLVWRDLCTCTGQRYNHRRISCYREGHTQGRNVSVINHILEFGKSAFKTRLTCDSERVRRPAHCLDSSISLSDHSGSAQHTSSRLYSSRDWRWAWKLLRGSSGQMMKQPISELRRSVWRHFQSAYVRLNFTFIDIIVKLCRRWIMWPSSSRK